MSFVSLVKWFRWLWLDPLPAYDYCLFEMIAIKSLYIRNTSILFFAKWCQNAIQASVQNCSFIAALTQIRTLTHTQIQIQIHKCRQKASIEFLYKFSSSRIFFLIFRDNPNVSACAWEHIGYTHTHTHIYIHVYVYFMCLCVCVCFLRVQAVPAPLWLEMRKSVFVHIKYSCIILNPLAIFSIWFSI